MVEIEEIKLEGYTGKEGENERLDRERGKRKRGRNWGETRKKEEKETF